MKYLSRSLQAVLLALFFTSTLTAAIVGTTKGEFTVNQGTASYSLKIDVPPGVAGMEPELSLNYNSNGGNGYMGVGWNIGGVSAITRCSQTKAVDGVNHKFGVKYDSNDRFCLDGQRLIVVKGKYGTDGSEYRTEIDTYARIKQTGIYSGSNHAGPHSFEVKTKSGLTYRYGLWAADNSGKGDGSAYLVINSRKIFWKVYDITDTYGNKIRFHYSNNYSTGENYLNKVTYADNAVEFKYQNRADKALGYSGGHKLSMTVRLAEVIVKTESTEVRRYKVAYTNESKGAKRSKISSITERVPEGDLKKLSMGYQGGSNSFSKKTSFSTDRRDALYFADLDGDGLQDYIRSSKNYLNFYKNMGNNTFKYQKRISSFKRHTSVEYGDFNGDGLIDILYGEGDSSGYVGIITNQGSFNFSSPKRYAWDTSKHNRTYYAQGDNDDDSVAPSATYVIGDFNADGISDIAFKKFKKVKNNSLGSKAFTYNVIIKVGKINGLFDTKTIFSNVTAMSQFHWGFARDYNALKVGDFNGDGLPDMLFSYFGKGGKLYLNQGNFRFTYSHATTIKANSLYMQLADFNGDGAVDIYSKYYTKGGLEAIWLNDGTGHFKFLSTIDVDSKNSEPMFMDINGDGYTDIYWYNAKGADKIILNNGHARFSTSYSLNPSNYLNYADIDGDGFTDLVETTSGGHIWFNQAKPPLLTRITNGTDQDIRIAYKNMTDKDPVDNLYDRRAISSEDIKNGNIPVTIPKALVYSVKNINGVGKYNEVQYEYWDYIINKLRGLQGFRYIITYDQTTKMASGVVYKQIAKPNGEGFQYTGMPSYTYTGRAFTGNGYKGSLDPWGKWLSKTVIVYKDASTRSKIYEPYTYSNVETVYDPYSKNAIKSVYHYNTISTDSLGNIVKTVDRTYDAINKKNFYKTTYNTFDAENITNWYIGRLSKSKMVHSQTDGHSVSRSSSFKYNTRGILSEEVANAGTPLALKKSYTYNSHGNKVRESISGSGISTSTTTYKYDTLGKFQTKVTDATGLSETKTYDPRFGTLESLTGPNGLTTTWQYDGLGRKIKETRADGKSTTWEHIWSGATYITGKHVVYSVGIGTDGKPFVRHYYDALGREVGSYTYTMYKGEKTDNDSRRIMKRKFYNAKGELREEEIVHYRNNPTSYIQTTYDDYGRATKVTKPGPGSTTQTYKSSYSDFTMTTTDPRGYKKQTIKNAMGQTLKITDAYGSSVASSISYTYDAAGNLLSTKDDGGNVITMTYDSAGNKIEMLDPDIGKVSYTYNAVGELVHQRDAKGQITIINYDILGRMVRKEVQLGTGWKHYNYYTNTYSSSTGRLIQSYASSKTNSSDWHGEKKYITYDSLGRVASVKTHIYGKGDFTTSTTYDSYSRPSTITYPNGYKVTSHYRSGILEYIKGSDGKVHYKIDELAAQGDIHKATFANGIKSMMLHDHAGFVGTLLTGRGTASTGNIQRIDYTYDQIGNVLEREDTSINDKHITDTFTYDGLNRLYNQSTSSDVVGAYTRARAYRYDKIGNITYNNAYTKENFSGGYFSGDHIGKYTYGSKPHAVTKAGSRVYRYDEVGNMIYRNGDTITYNPLNKPAILKNTKGEEVRFYYGVGGARFQKHTDDLDTYYIGKAYEERDDGNGNIEQIVYLSIGGKTIGTHTEKFNTGFDDPKEKANHYFHTDVLGSITAITDQTGKVIERRSYEPFGKIRAMDYGTNNNTFANRIIHSTRAFTGHEQIGEFSGLIHMNARLYDSDIGRFLSADTLIQYPEHSQGYNRYSYIENNPLMAPDPTGHGFFSFLGSIFKAIFSSIRTIASLVVAAVIMAYLPGALAGLGGIFATTATGMSIATMMVTGAVAGFASALVSTGSFSMALKAGFWGAISAGVAYGIGHGIQALQKLYQQSSKLAGSLYRALAHGLSRAVISVVRGGKALGGFLSGFAGSLLGGFAKGLENVDTITKTIIVAIAGGTASVLGGGKFANGAMSAAFIFMFNDMADYRLRQVKGRYGTLDKGTDRALMESGRTRERLVLTKEGLADGFSTTSTVSGTAATFANAAGLKPAALVLATSSVGSQYMVTVLNNQPGSQDMLEIGRDALLELMAPSGLSGALTIEFIKIGIKLNH